MDPTPQCRITIHLLLIDTLASRLSSLNVPAEDEAHQALASIRQLCRVLKGVESIGTRGVDGLSASPEGVAVSAGSSPSYQRANVSSDSNSSLMTMVMDGLNTPVEIGSDPTRTLPDFESPQGRSVAPKIVGPQHQHPIPQPQRQPKPAVVHVTKIAQYSKPGSGGDSGATSSGARQKVFHVPASSNASRPELGAVNELKEISRPKPPVSSSGDE